MQVGDRTVCSCVLPWCGARPHWPDEGSNTAAITIDAPHRIEGLLSIDHIAVPAGLVSAPCRRVVAEADGARLSDHDAYVVDVVTT